MIDYSQHSDNLAVSPVNQPELFKESWEDLSLSLKKIQFAWAGAWLIKDFQENRKHG